MSSNNHNKDNHPAVWKALVQMAHTLAQTEHKIATSDKTFHLHPTCLKYSIPQDASDDGDGAACHPGSDTRHTRIAEKLKSELHDQRKNPFIVCFSDCFPDEPHDHNKCREVNTWDLHANEYKKETICYHF